MKKCFLALAMCLMAGTASAQDDRYALNAADGSGVSGDNVMIAVTLDSVAGTAGAPLELQGWSYGLCHDGAGLGLTAVADGATTLTVNGGGAADFNAVNDAPMPGTGFTIGVVIDFFGVEKLAPGTGYEINVASYDLLGPDDGTVWALDFCNTLATPPVETLVVEDGGSSAVPVQNGGGITIGTPPVGLTLNAGDANGFAGNTVPLAITLDNPGDATEGFSFGLTWDLAVADLAGGAQGSDLAATNGGMGADFFIGTNAGGGSGFVGCVISLSPPFDELAAGSGLELAVLDITIDAGSVAGDMTSIDFSDAVGTPPVAVVVTVGGASLVPAQNSGTIMSDGPDPMGGNDFIRGDANDDGTVDVSDVAQLARALFGVSGPLVCDSAGDANDNGALDMLDDPIYLITYLFQMGPAPAAPFPTCGPDGTPDMLTCSMGSCP